MKTNRTPDAYAIRYIQPDKGCEKPNWTGIWNDREIAEDLLKAPGGGGKREIVELYMRTEAMDAELIICAAIKVEGEIIMGHRHHNCIRTASEIPRFKDYCLDQFQGFVTSTGRYVDRKEAAMIAYRAGQIHESRLHSGQLYSEDLY